MEAREDAVKMVCPPITINILELMVCIADE
jgi:hypothetical protein